MFADSRFDDIKPQTGSGFFCCHQRFEKVFLNFGSDAGAVVVDFRDDDIPFQTTPNSDGPASPCCLDGIRNEVEKDFSKSALIRNHVRKIIAG